MPNTIQIKRSLLSAAPATLTEGEMAYVFGTDTLYIGGPGGNTIIIIGGASTFAKLVSPAFTGTPTAPTATAGTSTTQIATTAFVAAATAGAGVGDMKKSTYDTTNNGVVDDSEKLGGIAANQYGLKTDITTAINNLLNGAGSAYDTLKELQDLIVADESTASALSITVAGKLAKASNLSDVASVSTARTNLGLGTMATQNAAAVAITGGTIDGVSISGGVF
jgi:hypothetical protein